MSVYSAKASFSSSSSSSSSASSSGSTGCFSETSFSSLSTIIAPQAGVKPFGDPDYNYFWIQNQSKANPKASYYYNYKSHSVVWSRPLPKTVPLPLYSSAWVPEPKIVSEGEEEEEVVVSDPEDAFQKQRRLLIKQRNRRLIVEDKSRTVDLVSVDNTVKSRKKLDVFWKLYRQPGESVEDVKNRLLEPKENEVVIKTEVLSDKDENNKTQDVPIIDIKEEPFYNDTYDDYSMEVQEASQSIQEHKEDSDSDPDNVDFFIQQDYNAANSYDSEMENESYDENGSDNNSREEEQSSDNEEEESSWDSNDDSDEGLVKTRQLVKNYFYQHPLGRPHNDIGLEPNIENCNLEESEEVDGLEEEFLLSNMLEIEFGEEDKENVCSEFNNTAENEETEEVDWYFEKSSETAENSLLTRAALNPVYRVSKPKSIVDKRKNKKPTKEMPVETRRVPKIIIKKEPYYHIKQEPAMVTSEPLVYEMYGTRTTNYDYYPQSKEARWESCTMLSDSSREGSVIETIAQRIKNEPRRASQNSEKEASGEQGQLELRNWFPKTRRDSRKRKNSDNSWLGSDLSANSDSDESVRLLKTKRGKRRSSIDEQEQFQPESTASKSSNSEQKQALTSAMDLSAVKVELHSSQEDLIGFTQEGGFSMKTQEETKKEEEEKDVVQNEKPKEEENDATADSESDSSSCCSRSSCSCSSSSSSSSSSDDENDKQAKKEDL